MCFSYTLSKNSKGSHKTKSHLKELFFFFDWSKSDFSFLELTEHDLKKKETPREPIFNMKELNVKNQELASLLSA